MSTLLDIARLRATERIDRQFEPSVLGDDADFRLVGMATLAGVATKDGRKVRLAGTLQATLECPCSRCLDPLAIRVDSTLDLLFLPASDAVPAGTRDAETGVEADDLGVSFYQDDVLDLSEVVREQLFLAVPMKPLCADACRGLCPTCGVNRNREDCSCNTEWVDPRFDALRRLKSP
jgi:uncharacterized protein